ncbi:ABC transporter ATP-binding protein [Candidatus Heimdallarchaeota archaeon B3_Heim]|nr:MAG: ABC transporter ATP-binding protein [Candidatus Heimdallarchaeota archaeon B3_Heim]
MSQTVLRGEKIYSGYGKLQVINGIDIHIDEGELVTIIGPNGSGKSTLIRTMIGLVNLFDGHVFIRDKEVSRMKPHEIIEAGIPLGYVPQLSNVFPSLTIEENLKMGLFVKKWDDYYQERTHEMFKLFPILEERIKQKASLLSGGERQMLALARALMPSPEVLILDEPTAALAPNLAEDMLQLIVSLKKELKISILLVEQRAKRSMELSDRGYVLVTGEIAAEGPANELLAEDKIKKLYLGVRDRK